jgi:HYR domain-containing protein
MKRQLFVLLAALLVAAWGVGRAHAAGGTYHIKADGNPILGWSPRSGAIDQVSDDKLRASGTLVGDFGSAPYEVAAGPGIVRATLSGSFTGPAGFSNPFAPGTQVVSTTEITINGPDGELDTSVNVHVDGFLGTPVCGDGTQCGALNVHFGTFPFGRTAEFDTLPETRVNDLGLAFDPVPGGWHIHGDVIGMAFGMRTNTPTPLTISISLSGGFGAGPELSTLDAHFEASFDPARPVLNDIPAGYTVTGPSVVDNHWTDPFGPPPAANVVVTSCAQLAQPTVVHGNLVIRNLAGCPTIALPNLTRVDGDVIIEGTDASRISLGDGTSVGGDVVIDDNNGATEIGLDSDVSGNVDISGNAGATVIGIGDGQIGGDCTIVDNGDAVVNAGGGVGGDLTLETTGDPFSGTTAGGTTEVTVLDATATMHVLLPKEAFAQPVPFTITRTVDAPPEAGTASDGSPALIDPIFGYRFAFDIPTLNADAGLTFVVDLSQLDAQGRADLLNAIAAGIGTIAVKGDAPDAEFHAFPQCADPQTPSADGCVSVTLLNASGVPAGPNDQPAFVRFEGVAGHFSTYAVVRVLAVDTTPPTIAAPVSVAVDATSPAGARVTYAASAHDDRDPAPRLACTPAAGSVFAIGDTTVSCLATDAAGNKATARFVVHVRGAGEQIVALIDKTLAFLDLPSLKFSLRTALQSIADGIVARNPRAACRGLNLYAAAVKLAPAKAFTPAERAELVADAIRIESVVGC